MSIISLKNVSKFYYNKNTISSGFNKLNLDIDMGEFVVITGESGSGKSTLLNVISGLDSYEEGEMYINGEETSHYNEIDYENYRRKYIGNIFQHFNLINSYTVYQNIELVLLLNGYNKNEIEDKILDIIKTVGLTKYKNTKASKLSGGQKQRVAIARALAKDTPIIVADEPTGNLDIQSAKSIMKLLKDISANKLVVIVTHNYEQVENYATRKISMNDGKIIEDKNIQPHTKIEAELVKYEDLTLFNKFRLGIRNAFNIKAKFMLLFLVYFFLTLLVFSEYSSLEKQSFDQSLEGYNEVFQDSSVNRVILNKKDKSVFSDDEIESISKLNNIERVEKNDLLLDTRGRIYDEIGNFYLLASLKSLKNLDHVDEGSLPQNENEIVIEGPRNAYDLTYYEGKIIGKEYTFQENNQGIDLGKVKITGIIYNDENGNYLDNYKIYAHESMLEKISSSLYTVYLNVKFDIDGYIVDRSDFAFNKYVMPSSKVSDGEILVNNRLNSYCNDYNCLNKKMDIKVSSIYFDDSMNLKVTNILDKDNFRRLVEYDKYDDYSESVFISENDYNRLFKKGNYQISIYLDDLKKDATSIEELHDLGYNTYYMKENLVNPAAEIMGIMNVMKSAVFLVATVALFFISYFIIKIILKSRNIYFSTIRILGATKKVSRQLLNIELFVDINVAYFTFLILIILSKSDTIGWRFLQELVSFFTLKDYIAIYIILSMMSLLISNRYAHKLFKNSVMSTYREEV